MNDSKQDANVAGTLRAPSALSSAQVSSSARVSRPRRVPRSARVSRPRRGATEGLPSPGDLRSAVWLGRRPATTSPRVVASPRPQFGAGLPTPPRRGPKVSGARETFGRRCGSVGDSPQRGVSASLRPRVVASPRPGYTLVEILLVLAVLTLVAAVAWPELQKPFARRRLHWAADTVRTQWCQARCEAMKSGHVYAFRYVVRGDRFRTEAEDDTGLTNAPAAEPAAAAIAATAPATGPAEGRSPAPETVFLPVETGTLPEGVTFLPGEPAAVEPPAAPTRGNRGPRPDGRGLVRSYPVLPRRHHVGCHLGPGRTAPLGHRDDAPRPDRHGNDR